MDLAALKSAAQFIGILKRYNEHIFCVKSQHEANEQGRTRKGPLESYLCSEHSVKLELNEWISSPSERSLTRSQCHKIYCCALE